MPKIQVTSAGGGNPAGNDTEVQYNSSGAFGANSALTWDGTTLAATNFNGTLDATSTLADGVVGTTQAASDNSTKIATTAYADDAVTTIGDVNYLKLDCSNDPLTAGLQITGSADENQLTIISNSTQTTPQIIVEDSSNLELFSIGAPNASTLFIGEDAGNMSGTYAGQLNYSLGRNTLQNITAGERNVAIGDSCLQEITSLPDSNVAIGDRAMQLVDGDCLRNIAIGQTALLNMTNGDDNVAIGTSSLYALDSGAANTALGSKTLNSMTSGSDSVAIGSNAGVSCTSFSACVAIGSSAMANPLSPVANVAIGRQALLQRDGQKNTGIGYFVNNGVSSSGNNSTYIGAEAGQLDSASNNTHIGMSAGKNGMGTLAVTVGYQTGRATSGGGARSTYIGAESGENATGDDNVFLGYAAGQDELGSDKLYIANSNTTTPLIYGEFDNEVVKINGRHEITKAVRHSAVETITASSDTLDNTNYFARCDCTSNAITINLPAVSGNTGLTYVVKKVDSTANAVTVDASGAETIDGSTTAVISSQYDSITLICNGTTWDIT